MIPAGIGCSFRTSCSLSGQHLNASLSCIWLQKLIERDSATVLAEAFAPDLLDLPKAAKAYFQLSCTEAAVTGRCLHGMCCLVALLSIAEQRCLSGGLCTPAASAIAGADSMLACDDSVSSHSATQSTAGPGRLLSLRFR